MKILTNKYGDEPKTYQFDVAMLNWNVDQFSSFLEDLTTYRGHGWDRLYAAVANLLMERAKESYNFLLLIPLWLTRLNESYQNWAILRFPGIDWRSLSIYEVIKEENRYGLAAFAPYISLESQWEKIDRAIDAWKDGAK